MSTLPTGITLLATAAVLRYKIDGPMGREIEAGLKLLQTGKTA